MAEYIKREDAINLLHYHADEACSAVVADFESIPAADVAPVVHGRWVQCFEDWRKQIEGDKCSACNFEHYGCSINHYHYCPNCGAKMYGER